MITTVSTGIVTLSSDVRAIHSMSLMRTWPVWARLLIFWITTAFFPRRPSTFVFSVSFLISFRAAGLVKNSSTSETQKNRRSCGTIPIPMPAAIAATSAPPANQMVVSAVVSPFNNQKHSQDSQPDNWFHKTPPFKISDCQNLPYVIRYTSADRFQIS